MSNYDDFNFKMDNKKKVYREDILDRLVKNKGNIQKVVTFMYYGFYFSTLIL